MQYFERSERIVSQIIEDIDYNNKMLDYQARLKKAKIQIETTALSNVFIAIVILIYEVYASWNSDNKLVGIPFAITVLVLTIALSSTIIVKRIPELFLINAAVYLITGLIASSLVPIIIALMDVAFYFLVREINEIKRLDGYPLFMRRNERN